MKIRRAHDHHQSSSSSSSIAVVITTLTIIASLTFSNVASAASAGGGASSGMMPKAKPGGAAFRLPWSKSKSYSSSSSTSATTIPSSSSNTSIHTPPRGGATKKQPVMKGAASSNNSATTTASATATAANAKRGKMKKKKMAAVKKGGIKTKKSQTSRPTTMILPNNNDNTNNNNNNTSKARGDTMPSIFRIPSEEKYDRYAAALAVTEGLRRVRDGEIERALVDKKKGTYNNANDANGDYSGTATATAAAGNEELEGGIGTQQQSQQQSQQQQQHQSQSQNNNKQTKQIKQKMTPSQQLEERKRRAESAFLLQSTKAVKALGMTVSQFNQIGREVLGDPALKERVSEQAYLYRMASAINLERVPLLEDPQSKKLLQSHRRHRVQMFARSITEIEELRADQMEALRQSLHVERFPPGFDLSDPNVQPLLHPQVRSVCEAFPVQAEEIVKRYGMESDEFNKMLEETKRNPIFGWRVKKYVEKVEEEKAKEKKAFGTTKN